MKSLRLFIFALLVAQSSQAFGWNLIPTGLKNRSEAFTKDHAEEIGMAKEMGKGLAIALPVFALLQALPRGIEFAYKKSQGTSLPLAAAVGLSALCTASAVGLFCNGKKFNEITKSQAVLGWGLIAGLTRLGLSYKTVSK